MRPLLLCLLVQLSLVSLQAQTANPDSYSTLQDTPLLVAPSLLSSNFANASVSAVPFDSATWAYLDTLTASATNYPFDTASRPWNSPAFDAATSSVSGWKSAPLPLVGGSVAAFPTAPSTLGGLGSPNSVNTYLFRNSVTLTADQALNPSWSLSLFANDGAVVYVNGREVGRYNLPAGVPTPSTFASATGHSTTPGLFTFPLLGILQQGVNTVAVELHQQSATSPEVAFDLALYPALNGQSGFVGVDDPFGTNQPDFSTQTLDASNGFGSSPGLRVRLTNQGGSAVVPTSGAWRRVIRAPHAGDYTLSVRARLTVAITSNFLNTNFGEAVLRVNGTRYGSDTGPSLKRFSRAIGSTGTDDSGWVLHTLTVPLVEGDNTVELGAYHSDNVANITTNTYFDDFSLSPVGPLTSVLANDSGASLTATLASGPAHGSLTLASNGSFLFVPELNYRGPDSFTYQAVSAGTPSAPATVTLAITGVNQKPAAANDSYNGTEEQALIVNAANGLLANDSDPDPATTLAAGVVTSPASGSLSLSPDGSFTYTPAANVSGPVTFTYRVSDGFLFSDPATVTLNLANTPDTPVAIADAYAVISNSPLSVTLPSGGTNTSHALITKADTWKYLDSGVYPGAAWTQISFDDSAWLSGPGELGYGDAADGRPEPTVVSYGPDANNKHVTTWFRRTLSLNDPARVKSLTINLMRDDGAVVYLNGNEVARSNMPAGTITATTFASGSIPNADEFVYFPFTIPPALLVTGSNTISVEVHQPNLTSTDLSFDAELVAELYPVVGLLANDSDPDSGDSLTVTLLTPPASGTLALNPDGTFLYTPATGFTGSTSFTYAANDGTLVSTPATVTFNVAASTVNVAPAALADSYPATEDATLMVNPASGLLANDSDPEGSPLTVSPVASPTVGSLTLNTDGSFSFTPPNNFSGPVTFTYRVFDGFLFSTPATVTLNVAPVNDAPSAADNSFFTNGSGILNIAAPGILGNDSDPDSGDALTAVLVATTTHGNLTLNADGSFSYTPDVSFSGVDTFTYQARDTSLALSPIRTVHIEINHAPIAVADSFNTSEDTRLSVAAPGVLANDTDSDPGQTLTLAATLVTTPAHGSVLLNSDGSFSYVSETNYSGPDSFTYAATDGRESSPPVTVSLTVASVDDVPAANDDSYEVRQEVPRIVGPFRGVLANDRDPEANPLSATVATQPLHGTLSLAADGSFTYTPAPGFSGSDSFTYNVSDGAVSSTATVSLRVKSHAETVVISEVMFHPTPLTAEEKTAGFTNPDQFEWFELHNPSAASVDVSNWSVTKGVSFTFPAATSIPAGGYLVVAAQAAAFQSRHPGVANFVAGWIGTLSNTAETIAVADSLAIEMDSASYADEGAFASRVPITDSLGETGWEWSSPADGLGASLEVRNLLTSNKKGHNWAASLVSKGTPGAQNGNNATDLAPLLSDLSHSPAVPRTGQTVTVTVRADDEADAPPSLTLHWRAATATPGAFATAAMKDDGIAPDVAASDGIYTGTIPAQATDKTVVEFRVAATDVGGLPRSFPGTADGSGSLALLQFDNETYSGNQPVYRVIATEVERAYFAGSSYDHTSNAGQNITFLYTSGFGTDIRYNATLRYRGNSSRTSTPMTCRVTFPSDADWNGQTAINLNSQFPHFQTLGNRLCTLAGLPGTPARMVQMRFNGVNQTNATSNQIGSYAHLDAIDGNYLKLMFPGDSDGNLYSKRRPGSTNTALAYRNNPAGNLYLADGYSKESNADSSDYSDLDQLLFRLNQASVPTPYTSWWHYMNEVGDLDQWMRYLAFNTFLNSQETNVSNGMDDDYDFYRPLLDGRFKFVQHDLDTIFGSTTNLPLFQTNVSNGTGVLADNGVLPVLEKLFNDNKGARRYYYHYLDLANGLLNPATFDALVDNMMADTPLTATARNSIKTNNASRRTYILSQIKQTFTLAHNLTVTNGYPTTATATGLRLSGDIPAAYAASVTINGIIVTQNNRAGTWESNAAASAFPFSLTKGLNRLVVECRDEAGAILASSELEVWLTATGTTASVNATGTTTWTAANSPYNVTANLAVPAEATLVLEPGTTVQFASGVALNVAGVITAEGTATNPVKFVAAPGVVSWNGIQILNSPAQNIFRHCVFSGASPGNTAAAALGMLGQSGSSSLVEDCLFENCTRRRIRSQLSDLIVRRCTFAEHYPGATVPDAANNNISEHIWGSAKPVGGTFLLEFNTFGKLKGHNDSVDVDGSHGGTVLLIRNNVFLGGGDDAMDLQGDSVIEGNLITNQIKDEYNLDPGNANGLSAGDNQNTGYHYVVLRNTFVNCEQVVFVKENTLCDFHHNTVVGTHLSSLYFDLAGQTAGPGKQLNASGNLFADCVGLIIDPVGSTPVVNVSKNFSTKSLGAYQGDTLLGTPLFTNAAALDFNLRPESPARAAGPLGRNCGSSCPSGVAVGGLPESGKGSNGRVRHNSYSFPVGGPGVVEYQWRDKLGPWSAPTPISNPLVLNDITSNLAVDIQGRDISGVWSNTVSFGWKIEATASPILLSEVLASNSAGDDFVELYNDSDEPADLSGLRLSDAAVDLLIPAKFTVPAGTILLARGRLVFTATQLGFNLAETGETVSLYPPVAQGNSPIDSLAFGWQLPDLALARRPGDNAWTLATPTPGAAFSDATQPADPASLKINEWLAGADVLLGDDFVELHNAATAPVLLSGLTLSDFVYPDAVRRPGFPAFTYIAAGGFRAFLADGNTAAGADHLAFKLDASTGHLQLRDASLALMNSVTYNPQQPDRSQGRSPDGGTTFAYFTTPTPSYSNTAASTETGLLAALRVTEIHFHPAGDGDLEFIELKNIGATTLDLSGVRLTSGADFTFSPAASLAAGASTVLVRDLAKFTAFYGPGRPVAGTFTGRLDNAGETLRLETPRGLAIHDFRYEAFWQPLSDGLGSSLEIISETSAASTWSTGTSWRASLLVGGSPGGSSVFVASAGPDYALTLPSVPVLRAGLTSSSPVPGLAYAWTQVSGPAAGFTSPSLASTAVSLPSAGTYVFRLTATSGALTSSDEVTLTATLTPLETWRGGEFGPDASNPAIAGDTADPDHDGLPNLLEYALGLSPLTASAPKQPVATANGETTYTYRRRLGATGFLFALESADSPSGTYLPVTGATTTLLGNDGSTEEVRLTFPDNGQPNRFLRLRVTAP